MDISINDDTCWVCGEVFTSNHPKTMHHVLPKHIKPKRNILVPICEPCHEKVTSEDTPALINYMHKLEKTTQGLQKQVGSLKRLFDTRTIGSIIKNKK